MGGSPCVIIIRSRRGGGEATGLSEAIDIAPGLVGHSQDVAMRATGFDAVTNLNSWIDQLGGTSVAVGSEVTTPQLLVEVAARFDDVAALVGTETDEGDVEDIETLFEAIRAELYAHSVDVFAAS